MAANENLAPFEEHRDMGNCAKPGSVVRESRDTFVISGGGENMWFTNDAFHFAWKKLSGDFSLTAAVEWLGKGGNAHRKACLLVRQSLEPDAAYVDIAVHGVGLTSLQFRETKGGVTREVQTAVVTPRKVALERQGEVFFASVAAPGQGLSSSGATIRLELTDPVLVGLGVCAHDNSALEKARFSEVALSTSPRSTDAKPRLESSLQIVPIASKDRRVVYHAFDHFEAPNWSRDGRELIYNSNGRLYRIDVRGGTPVLLDTGFAQKCNNDHGLSFDGTQLAISDQTRTGKSLIYVLPSTGGTPRQVTALGPSYWHGWSPDGSTLAYCAERNGEFDVYTIPVNGGEEKRLTTAKGLDDGPEYSPDGNYIYFNSERTGRMQIWRMKADGSDQEQVTSDEFNNWFPHPSPDGKWLVFLTYDADVQGHPANKPVRLRLMPIAGGPVQELARLFGGQGTINVPSWSPDSKQVAFVGYELLRAP